MATCLMVCPFLHPETKPNQMGVHKFLPAVGPRRGRRLGRILRVALSFRSWLSLLALLCLLSFALFGLKFITLVGRGGGMESGISSLHQLPITGNVKKYNKEVEQQQLQHSGFGKVVIKAPGSKKRIQRKGNALFDRSLF
ncbi:hypothetical protein NC651_024290 [Populus alba x Populus x berolinensis]|nr:hypothetical protein NC651_024290 [Populus alba x Populus x berolinensis]